MADRRRSRRALLILALALSLLAAFLPAASASAVWYARGDFNGWGTTDPMLDDGTGGDAAAGDGIYTAQITIAAAGRYEFKVATDSWSPSYPGSGNSWFVTSASDEVVILTFDTNVYADGWLPEMHAIGASPDPGAWTAVGDWQGWNNADPATAMASLGGGLYELTLPIAAPGTYQYKAVRTGSWDAIGADSRSVNAATAAFETTAFDQNVHLSLDALEGRVKVEVEPVVLPPAQDGDIWWDGLGHDSRDDLYRIPAGAVPAGTTVVLRVRTFHDDVTGVTARVWDTAAGGQTLLPMTRVATTGDPPYGYDYWETTLPTSANPTTLWYRFIVRDGVDEDYYEDDDLFDGGWGVTYDDSPDRSFQINVYEPGFETPAWIKDAVIYQIFPDRFFNGDPKNDPEPSDPTVYGNPVQIRDWEELPEGYCRAYEDVACDEGPLGRDFFGGDLQGVKDKLDYLADLGVTAIYFNPIFEAPSNHLYDTTDYFQIDPSFGSIGTYRSLVNAAERRGIRIILDGVFNHTSSDSIYFDRYDRYPKEGAYESLDSRYAAWYTFYEWPASYNSWWGFDSLPVLTEHPEVSAFIYGSDRSVARWWVELGAAGWRLDVAPDKSHTWWQAFRPRVKAVNPDAVILGEIWDDASPWLLGNEFDSTMNYRFRRALIGFVNGDTQDPNQGYIRGLSPTQFDSVLHGIEEDYPPQAYAATMNLVSTHDTQRILWALTPGARNQEGREFDAANVAEGLAKLKLLAIIQLTMPGAPTIYYGDEVGLTGDTDPDDRRPFPWGSEDEDLLAHYQALISLRNAHAFLRTGSYDHLETGNPDADGVYAYGRRDPSGAAIIAVNRDVAGHAVSIDVAGYIPEGTMLTDALSGDVVEVAEGKVSVDVEGRWGAILVTPEGIDLTPPPAPSGLSADAGDGRVALSWEPVAGAAGYWVYRSPVSGGGYLRLTGTPVLDAAFLDENAVNGQISYYVVTAVDSCGNESERSNEAQALPYMQIGWANLQWPPTIEHTISALVPTPNIYGQVWIDGHTWKPGATPGLVAQVGYGPDGSHPDGHPGWMWVDAVYNVNVGNNDEFMAALVPEAVGVYDYAYRYSTTGGQTWIYADLDGTGNGYSPDQAGALTVLPSGDATPPAIPQDLHVLSAAPSHIALTWDPVGDADLYRYELYRADASGGPYVRIADVHPPSTVHEDWDVVSGATYYYVVLATDTSFNRSAFSGEAMPVAQARPVQVTLRAALPETTPEGDDIYVAGSFNGWNPAGTLLVRDGLTASITLTFDEGTQIEYKYTRGSWTYVEKGATCEEISNRQLTVLYGADGTMTVDDTVLNWRNTGACGD
ncbi:MAG: alpha-amylase [Anaerolineae bacterium]|nr:alpha-amylase [Anaerolineae bacterium]